MKNPRRFKIPLRWLGTEQFEEARADVLALPLDRDPSPILQAVRVGSVGKKGPYMVEVETYSSMVLRFVTATRLEHFPVGAHVLVERNIADITPCVATLDGETHTISWLRINDWRYMAPTADVVTLCRRYVCGIRTDRFPVGPGVTTCPACRQVTSAWFPYTIEPYTHPKAVEKLEGKLRSKARRRERYPTSYDHLLRDVFGDEPDLPPPAPKPEPVKPTLLLPGDSGQRDQRRETAKRGRSYAKEKAELLRRGRGR